MTCNFLQQSMASELNMYESQVAEHKMDIDRLQRELQEVKKKYYLQKKKDHQQRLATCILLYRMSHNGMIYATTTYLSGSVIVR